MSHHKIVRQDNGNFEVRDPDGNTIASDIQPPVSTIDDKVLNVILDDAGVTDQSTRDALKAIARGVEIR